jgi:hypothetical protein
MRFKNAVRNLYICHVGSLPRNWSLHHYHC